MKQENQCSIRPLEIREHCLDLEGSSLHAFRVRSLNRMNKKHDAVHALRFSILI